MNGVMGMSYNNILRFPSTLSPTDIPAGSQHVVKFYKGTTFVSSEVISTVGRVLAPSEMTPAMFPSLTLNTYAQLCPNKVATQSSFYAFPSTLTQQILAQIRLCGYIDTTLSFTPVAIVNFEAKDAFKRKFNAQFDVAGP
jgi:hypothetical protein